MTNGIYIYITQYIYSLYFLLLLHAAHCFINCYWYYRMGPNLMSKYIEKYFKWKHNFWIISWAVIIILESIPKWFNFLINKLLSNFFYGSATIRENAQRSIFRNDAQTQSRVTNTWCFVHNSQVFQFY